MPYNIDISGNGNKTSLVIDSNNATINAGGDTIEDYISDIQIYIRRVLSDALNSQFLSNNNLAITSKTSILDNIELCWVGEPESFYSDVSNLDIQNNGLKIFSHFMETTNTVTHHIRLQTNDGSFVTIPFSLTNDIFRKIQYVNSKVPDKLKEKNQQGYHTLGLINNNISFDVSGVPRRVKDILNSLQFGITTYSGLWAYEESITKYVNQSIIINYSGDDLSYNNMYFAQNCIYSYINNKLAYVNINDYANQCFTKLTSQEYANQSNPYLVITPITLSMSYVGNWNWYFSGITSVNLLESNGDLTAYSVPTQNSTPIGNNKDLDVITDPISYYNYRLDIANSYYTERPRWFCSWTVQEVDDYGYKFVEPENQYLVLNFENTSDGTYDGTYDGVRIINIQKALVPVLYKCSNLLNSVNINELKYVLISINKLFETLKYDNKKNPDFIFTDIAIIEICVRLIVLANKNLPTNQQACDDYLATQVNNWAISNINHVKTIDLSLIFEICLTFFVAGLFAVLSLGSAIPLMAGIVGVSETTAGGAVALASVIAPVIQAAVPPPTFDESHRDGINDILNSVITQFINVYSTKNDMNEGSIPTGGMSADFWYQTYLKYPMAINTINKYSVMD